MSLDVVLKDLREELAALFGAGLATPGPGRAAALRGLAETLVAAGLDRTAAEVGEIAHQLDTLVSGEAEPDELERLHERLQRLTTWEVQIRRAWALRARRAELSAPSPGAAAAPRRPPGLEGVALPLGVTLIEGRILFVAKLRASGERVVLHDDWPGVPGPDPVRSAQASRLFQEPVVPAEVLAHPWHLDDHPAVRRRGRWIAGPSFFTRPRVLDEPLLDEPLPDRLTLRWTTDGWTLWSEGGDEPLDVVSDSTLDFNLRKQRVLGDAIDVRLAASGDRHAIVAMSDALGRTVFPTVDPAAVVWPARRLVDLAERIAHPGVTALVDALVGRGRPPASPRTFGEAVVAAGAGEPQGDDAAIVYAALDALPPERAEALAVEGLPVAPRAADVVRRLLALGDPAERRALVRAHTASVTRAMRRGEVLPPGRDLWLLSALHARLVGDGEPLAVDLDRVRLAAANPLSRALRGEPVSAPELEDALALVVGWTDGPRYVG